MPGNFSDVSNLKEIEDNLGFAVRAKVVCYNDWLGDNAL